jgi:Zn-dependent protease
VAALLLFASVLLHELSHSAVARTRGLEVEGITLFIFGGVAQTRMEARTAADEFLLTAAGPLSSLALGGLFWGLALLAETAGLGAPVVAVARTLALVNVALAIFNMIPGFPLDGGRIFRSAVWHFTGSLETATRWASRGGQAFGWLLMGFGAVSLWQGFLLNGLWAAFIGWFLSSAASSSWRHFEARQLLSDVPVARVMTADPVTVEAADRVADVVERHFLRRPYEAYPVLDQGRAAGLLTLEAVASLGPSERREARVRQVMEPLADVPTAGPEEGLDEVLTRLSSGDHDQALVVEDGRLVGLLTLGEISSWIQRLRKLGLDGEDGRAGDAGPASRPPTGTREGSGTGVGTAPGSPLPGDDRRGGPARGPSSPGPERA